MVTEPSEYQGLWLQAFQRARNTARAAGILWIVVIAVLALPWEPWRETGWAGLGRWALALLLPLAALLLIVLAFHLVREVVGRYRLRPTVVWNEGRWWFRIRPRGLDGDAVTVRCKVVDEDGSTARHEFTQGGDDIIDIFPDQFDVAGMKAGRRQPWGRYEVTWEVFQRSGRKGRATLVFDWHAILLPG
jgi:hypothetical protein